jgi:oligopeptide transport system ATP-binding protein
MRLIPQPPGRILSGEVLFGERNLLELSPVEMQQVRGSKIAMIFQDPMTSLNPVLTIGRQIGETMMVHLGMSEKDARKAAVGLLDQVGIPNPEMRLDDYPHHFSGGMRQRVMIAMALSCKPRLLIADEPTTALDVTIQAQILDLVKQLRDERGMAVIWISHDLAVIAELADRVAVMYSGYVVEEADVFELYRQPLHPYTLALLHSLPRLDTGELDTLASIPGSPPDGTRLPRGCPFAPRCRFTERHCTAENPPLREVGQEHHAACWVIAPGAKNA